MNNGETNKSHNKLCVLYHSKIILHWKKNYAEHAMSIKPIS